MTTPPNGNGHAPADLAQLVEIDPAKIGLYGNRLLGRLDALSRWTSMFSAYAQKTLDLRERQVLIEVSKALLEDAEKVKLALTQHALKRGAAKVVDATEDDEGIA